MTEQRHYIFRADNGLVVSCLRGDEPPTPTSGYGGWDIVARPRRLGFTKYTGREPIRMRVPVIFDGWRANSNIEAEVGLLARMSLPDKGGEPPTVDVEGAMPRRDIDRWVIESLDWGTNVIWGFNTHGVPVRFRQDVVVNLLQFVAPDPIPPAHRGGAGRRPRPKHKWHVVKRGETLRKISVAEYGNQKWWRDIQKANHIKDPKKLRVGQKLRMP